MGNSPSQRLFSASEVLQSLLQNSKSPISDQFLRWKLWRQWPDLVGEEISKRTLPVNFDQGTLFVWVENSVWLQQLTFMVGPLKNKINEHVGKDWVRQIRFTVDRRAVPTLEESEAGVRTFLEQASVGNSDRGPNGRKQ